MAVDDESIRLALSKIHFYVLRMSGDSIESLTILKMALEKIKGVNVRYTSYTTGLYSKENRHIFKAIVIIDPLKLFEDDLD